MLTKIDRGWPAAMSSRPWTPRPTTCRAHNRMRAVGPWAWRHDDDALPRWLGAFQQRRAGVSPCHLPTPTLKRFPNLLEGAFCLPRQAGQIFAPRRLSHCCLRRRSPSGNARRRSCQPPPGGDPNSREGRDPAGRYGDFLVAFFAGFLAAFSAGFVAAFLGGSFAGPFASAFSAASIALSRLSG